MQPEIPFEQYEFTAAYHIIVIAYAELNNRISVNILLKIYSEKVSIKLLVSLAVLLRTCTFGLLLHCSLLQILGLFWRM